MQQGLLPLFPLEVVLFPGRELPLHIFEDRYKEMIGEAVRDRTEFGIVLANQQGLANVGCTAIVDRVLREYPDGRMDILAIGKRRFEILLVNEERSFLRGVVEFFEDEEGAASLELRDRAVAGFEAVQALNHNSPLDSAQRNDPMLSFRLAEVVPDLGFRHNILCMRCEAERIAHLAGFLPGWAASQQRVQKIKDAAPTNGHGRKKVPGQ